MLVHLVQLPKAGFTHIDSRQKNATMEAMGFDLSALEPALSQRPATNHMPSIRKGVESIQTAIDTLRRMEARAKLTITEREMYNYRMMSLNDVDKLPVI